jgi:hypothetical protein
MDLHPRRTERPYFNGLTWNTMGRFLSWLALSIPLVIFAMGIAPTAAATGADDDSAGAQVSGEVDEHFDFDAAPDRAAPPWPLATFLGDNSVDFTGSASDLFAAGNLVRVGGLVDGNAFVAGQTVDLKNGAVTGDLFVAAETLTLDEDLQEDVYMVGGNCRLDEDAVVRGNVYMGCGTAVIAGTVGGSIVGGGGEVTLNGPVGGDVELEVGHLTLGSEADIGGDLRYASPDEAKVDGDSAVGGAVDFTQAEQWDDDDQGHKQGHGHQGPGFVGFFLKHVWALLSALLVGFVIIALLGDRFRRPIAPLLEQPGKSLGIGFVLLVCVPVASLIAIALILTLPMGVIGLVLYAVAIYLAALLPALALGRLILERSFGKEDPSPYASLALGLLILHLLFAIPLFGALIHVVVASAGLGALYLASNRESGAPEA